MAVAVFCQCLGCIAVSICILCRRMAGNGTKHKGLLYYSRVQLCQGRIVSRVRFSGVQFCFNHPPLRCLCLLGRTRFPPTKAWTCNGFTTALFPSRNVSESIAKRRRRDERMDTIVLVLLSEREGERVGESHVCSYKYVIRSFHKHRRFGGQSNSNLILNVNK